MRPPLPFVVLISLAPAAASAASGAVTGAVPLRSYWDDGGTTIYSDVMVIHDDGSAEVVRELGGTVDGIRMIQFDSQGNALGTFGYVPTRNKLDAELWWSNSWVYITPDADGSPEVPGDGEMEALQAALGTWNDAFDDCSYMRFVLKDREPLEVGPDGKNTIKFRNDRWCRPARDKEPEKCYDPGATAITTLFFVEEASRPDNGMLLDADIEVNSVDYAMAVGCETRCVTDAKTGVVEDLQNTLTHELGHVLGLDHTCWPFNPESAPLDANGESVPTCRPFSSLPDWVVEATMYNYQEPMETKKRSPEADDIAGVCGKYPTASDPKIYEEVSFTTSGCCAVAGAGASRSRSPAGLLVLALALAGLTLRNRLGALKARACSRTRRR